MAISKKGGENENLNRSTADNSNHFGSIVVLCCQMGYAL